MYLVPSLCVVFVSLFGCAGSVCVCVVSLVFWFLLWVCLCLGVSGAVCCLVACVCCLCSVFMCWVLVFVCTACIGSFLWVCASWGVFGVLLSMGFTSVFVLPVCGWFVWARVSWLVVFCMLVSLCGVVFCVLFCGCVLLGVCLWWVSGCGRGGVFVFGFWLGFVFGLVAGVLFLGWCFWLGADGGLFLLVVWVVFLCFALLIALGFFGAILFVLVVAGLSGFLLALPCWLVLQLVFQVFVF